MRISDWSSDVCSSDLPAILAPAAHAFLATIADDRVPIAIGLFLIVGQNHEAHRLVGLEMRAAVQADERLAEHGELHRQFLASPGRRIVVRRRVARADMAVGEGRGIEFGGLAGRSEEHTAELQSLMRISYAVFCLNKKTVPYHSSQEQKTK